MIRPKFKIKIFDKQIDTEKWRRRPKSRMLYYSPKALFEHLSSDEFHVHRKLGAQEVFGLVVSL